MRVPTVPRHSQMYRNIEFMHFEQALSAKKIREELQAVGMDPPSVSTIQRIKNRMDKEDAERPQRNIDRAWSPVYV